MKLKKTPLVLCVMLALLHLSPGFFKANVVQAGVSPFAGGSGTSSDPYIINTAEQLNSIRDFADQSFKLGSDIDLSSYLSASGNGYNAGAGWLPISSNSAFSGTLDGNGYIISGLVANRPGSNNQGLFGTVGQTGKLLNVALVNVNVTGGYMTGGLAAQNKGTIEDSYVTGDVAAKDDPSPFGGGFTMKTNTGGLVGTNDGTITRSYSRGSVVGHTMAGGLAGENRGTIANSASTSTVDGFDRIGGLVGQNNGNRTPGFIGSIQNSYATGEVASKYASANSSIGGLVGIAFDKAEIINSYAANSFNVPSDAKPGGLIGSIADNNSGPGNASMYPNVTTITSSYWDTELSGVATSARSTGKSTAEMNNRSTFTGWDFTNIWKMSSDKYDGYPYIFDFPPDKALASGLTVTSSDVAGAANDGLTKLAVTPDIAAGNKLQYKNFGSAAATVPYVGDSLTGYTNLPAGGTIAAANGDRIGVAEVDGSNIIVKFGQVTAVVVDEPKTPASGLTVTSTDVAGAANDGLTKLAVAPDVAAGNKLQYKNFGSGAATVPYVGDSLTGYTNLPAGGTIAAANGDQIGVAEVDSSNVVVKFGQTTAVVADEPITYTIETISDQTMSSLPIGYSSGAQETKTITVTRTGTGDLLQLAVALSGDDASRFTISQLAATTLNDGSLSTDFTVSAKDGLPRGTYTATVTVTAAGMSPVTFTVTQKVAPIKGDYNGDGKITPADALAVTKYLNGLLQLTPEELEVLDMNDDQVVDSVDLDLIMQSYVGGKK